MPRTYSFDHFQAKKPMQAAVGSQERLGNDEDKQKPLKSELQEAQPGSVPGANQGEIHYGMAHSETVKRLQARRAARAKKEERGTAATKRPAGARKAATRESAAKPARTGKTARATKGEGTAKPAAKAKKPAARATKPATEAHTKAASGRKKLATREAPAVSAPAKRAAAAKQGLLGRVVGTVAKTALRTGSKGLARAAVLAKEVRASRSKTASKPDKSAARTEKPASKKDKPKKR